MSKRVRQRAFKANKRLPEGITQLLLEELGNLPECPKRSHLTSEILKKFVSDDTDPPEVRRQRAINKWLATERDNEGTNDRLVNTNPDFQILPGVEMARFLEFCCNLISSIIGDTVPEEALIGSFSGGASTSRSRTESHPASKYLGKAHVTSRALEWFEEIRPLVPGWSSFWDDLALEVVSGNVMFTVPKSTTIDRCACKEPDINMFLQKGAGSFIRNALRKVGINLNDQSRNRLLAQRGSIDSSLATLDLSSASDSVSRELVFQLLPISWFNYLDSIRSHVTTIDGEEHVNEMFSSMGNGFTFELESLLFYSIAKSVAYFTGTRGTISVYGDDIIVPTGCAHDLIWVLSWFGFTTNVDKSFVEGSFRESCGGHYTGGLDITPFYVKAPIRTLSDLILFLNQLRHWSETTVGINDPSVFPLWEFGASFVPARFWGGQNWATRYQLYSPGSSHSVLKPMTKSRSTGTGGYIHWLNSTMRRNSVSDGVVTSEATTASDESLLVRRVKRTVNIGIPLFPQEQG